TLSSENVSPRLQAQAIKALVVANRVIVNKAKNIANNGSEKDAAMAAAASSKLTESLLAVVKQLVSVGSSGMDVHYVSKSQPYFKDMEGSYLTMLAPLLDRFKALIKCHLYLLGSRGEKSDAINPRLIITIAGLIFDNAGGDKAKFGHHDAIYTDNLHLIMPTLVGWINRLLVSLISSLGQQMLPDRDSLWILIRKSFAYSSKSVPARISTYRLVTVFIETFGINGADSIYLGVMEDAVRDLAVSNEHVMSRSAASLVIASGKCLGAILTYASPQQFNNQSLSTLYSNVVKAMLSFVVDAKSTGSQPFRGSVQLAYAKLIVKCLQCHARDAYPMEWVASGMRSLVVAVAAADAELKPRLEELIHAHSDVLFGYRPVISRTVIPDIEEANPGFGGTYAQGGVTGGRIYASVLHSEIDSEKYDAHDHQAQSISANATSSKSANVISASKTSVSSANSSKSPPIRSTESAEELTEDMDFIPAPVEKPKTAAPPVFNFPVGRSEPQIEVEVEEKPEPAVKHTFVLPEEKDDDGDIELPDINIDESDDEDEEGQEEENEDES
ncbi:hypothetical protein HDU78_011761, partial [Chytriomyces hyalinus]